MGKPIRVVDEAAVDRLRHAITAQPADVDEEEQLTGVLRMLGAVIPDQNQLALFQKK